MAIGRVSLVGAGPGDPGLITVRGLDRLSSADVVIYDRLVDERLLARARPGAEIIYAGKEADHHVMEQGDINKLVVAKALEGKRVVRLKGGDPFMFGRGGEEAQALVDAGVPFEVVPGVTSAIAVPTYAGIPLTAPGYASSVAIVTGHEAPMKMKAPIAWEHLAQDADTLVILMGVKNLSFIVERLLASGVSPDTPVALIRNGSRPSQQTLTGTLGQIMCAASAAKFGPPAVIVIGEVVRLREKLRWFDNRPLFGKRVLVTRAREQAEDLSTLLTRAGAEAIEVPVIKIEPPDSWGWVDRAIAELNSFHWVIFTSANGVKSFFDRLGHFGLDGRALGCAKVAAIGPGTAESLLQFGIRADLVPREYVAESVAAGLAEMGVRGTRILLPRASEAREVLPRLLREQGALVEEVAVYRTTFPAESGPVLRELLMSSCIDVATFASSSAVRNALLAIGSEGSELLNRVVVACIGPITAKTAVDLGLRVDVVASEYTIEGLVGALEDYFRSAVGERR